MKYLTIGLVAVPLALLLSLPTGAGSAGEPAQHLHEVRTAAVEPLPTPETATEAPVPATVILVEPLVVTKTPTVSPTTTTTAPPLVATPGHFACSGADNETAECVNDEDGSLVTANHGDPAVPIDPAYAARLTADLCDAKPWLCQ